MSKRPVVLFFPVPSRDKPQPEALKLRSGNPPDPEKLLKKIKEHQLLPDIIHPQSRGKVLVGREDDHHIRTQDSRHPSAFDWTGTQNPDDFIAALRPHVTKFFQPSAAA